MGQHGAACLGTSHGGKAAHLLRRGHAMTDDTTTKAGVEGAGAGAHILLFEDDETLAGLLARVLRTEGYHVDVLDNADAVPARRQARALRRRPHRHPPRQRHERARRAQARARGQRRRRPVILMTAYADIEGAMNAVGEGAYDYLAKPIEPTELKRMVGEAVARRKLAKSSGDAGETRGAAPVAQIVGSAPSMIEVYKTVAQVAPTTATVLIVGESGTGKELVARAIHAKSPRATKPFVAINCAALPESILESELFGHERGSFTGASAHEARPLRGGQRRHALPRRDRRDQPEDAGAAAARAPGGRDPPRRRGRDHQGRRARRRGDQPRPQGGGGRGALPRGPALPPPGRHRARAAAARAQRDIPLLVQHFIARHSERLGRPAPHVAPEVFEMLESYEFPGNVRELSPHRRARDAPRARGRHHRRRPAAGGHARVDGAGGDGREHGLARRRLADARRCSSGGTSTACSRARAATRRAPPRSSASTAGR